MNWYHWLLAIGVYFFAFYGGVLFERLRWHAMVQMADATSNYPPGGHTCDECHVWVAAPYNHQVHCSQYAALRACYECGVYLHANIQHMKHCRYHPANKEAWRQS